MSGPARPLAESEDPAWSVSVTFFNGTKALAVRVSVPVGRLTSTLPSLAVSPVLRSSVTAAHIASRGQA